MSAFSCAAKSVNSTRMSISAHPWAGLGDGCAVTRTRAAIHTFSAHAAPRLVAGRARVLVGPQGQQAQQDLSLAACACLGAYTSRVRMEQLQTETCYYTERLSGNRSYWSRTARKVAVQRQPAQRLRVLPVRQLRHLLAVARLQLRLVVLPRVVDGPGRVHCARAGRGQAQTPHVVQAGGLL